MHYAAQYYTPQITNGKKQTNYLNMHPKNEQIKKKEYGINRRTSCEPNKDLYQSTSAEHRSSRRAHDMKFWSVKIIIRTYEVNTIAIAHETLFAFTRSYPNPSSVVVTLTPLRNVGASSFK
ncbi:hypothetical protein ACTXT7_007139 [Hymenolepis weldensis]